MSGIIEIDGSYLEGGGQILRNALSLSCILGKPIKVTKIRANRPNPGLSNQHLFGLDLLVEITKAEVKGNVLGSTEIEFKPKQIKSGEYTVNTRTAASVSLVLQAALPVLMFGSKASQVEIYGGTNVGMAPQVDYMTEVFRPHLELMGTTFDFDLIRRGYYPRGGGCCNISIPAVKTLKAINLIDRGKLTQVVGWCFVAGKLPLRLAEDMKNSIKRRMDKFQVSVEIEEYKENFEVARDNGSGVILKALTTTGCVIGAAVLGERHVDGHLLGNQAATQMEQNIEKNICVDEHVQDQLILFMALASGVSQIQSCALTNHTRSAIYVAELLTGVKFKIQDQGSQVIITCEGMGYNNKHIIGK